MYDNNCKNKNKNILEQPSGRHPSLSIITFFFSVFCSVLVPYSFRVTIVTLYSALQVTLRYLRHSTNWLFYNTLHLQAHNISIKSWIWGARSKNKKQKQTKQNQKTV